jgi:lysosomal acid lipase/cholesteryl ester hydrolase
MLKHIVAVVVGACVCQLACAAVDPEASMDVPGIIRHWGYPAEVHNVNTTDGYILTMHRIPWGRNQSRPTAGPRPVMFMQHGLECSSSNWVTNLPEQSAGFVFADAGFDVWMGNFRGNNYSQAHQWLDPKSHVFWEFSWDEMAMQDLPAMLGYVLNHTGVPKIQYMGHSMGTMTAFALFSLNTPLASKIDNLFALGPVATVASIKQSLLKGLAPYVSEISWVLEFLGQNQFLPSDTITKWLADYVCGWHYTNPLCDDIIFLIGGPDSHQMNTTRTPVYVAHTPSGTSVQNIQHFGQQVTNKQFIAFDWGTADLNRFHYHQPTPTVYDATTVQVPVHLYWGDNDILADPEDVKFLIARLPNLKGNHGLYDFNHLDFIWGLRAAAEVYTPIIETIKKGKDNQTGKRAKSPNV